MSGPMPPLNPLRVFEVAARSRSFTDAAVELSVTQAAVSRQVGVLEGYFGCRLFDREQRVLTLTAEGRRLQREIAPAFESIRWITTQLRNKRDRNNISIQTYPTIAGQVLLRHLPPFLKDHQKLNVNILTAVRPTDFTLNDVDFAIVFAARPPEDAESFLFARDRVSPALRPELLEEYKGNTRDIIANCRLLVSKYRQLDWHDWARAAGIDIGAARFMSFDSSQLAYRAAMDGLGVCMAQLFAIGHELDEGKLAAPFGTVLTRPFAYWCVRSPRVTVSRPISATHEWLRSLADPDAACAADLALHDDELSHATTAGRISTDTVTAG